MKKFTVYRQLDAMDCGPTCLRMICKHYGKSYSLQFLREHAAIDRQGVSFAGMSEAAEKIGFRTMSVKIPLDILFKEKPFPCILHWRQEHFVVLYKVKNGKAYIADPASGNIQYTTEELEKFWARDSAGSEGLALLLEPSPEFYAAPVPVEKEKKGFSYFLKYLIPHKKLILQLFMGLTAGSLLSLILPFLTQSLVDVGVNQRNMQFVYLVLISQLMLFIGSTAVNVIRSWILLHISTRLNISIISDFLLKLMKLPISFFDSRNLGDILQRIRDHDRIRQFLTSSSIQTLFSLVNIVIFGLVLLTYDLTIFLIFFIGSALYIGWVLLFLKRRKVIDYKRFNEAASGQSNEVQLVQGMQEIKLNQAERNKRWEWETIQIKLFNVNIKSLALEQYQSAGGAFLNELKNVLILFWSAKTVMDGDMTLGMMLATTQITGQLNSPISQLIGFIQQAQDASISLERLSEIHGKENEESEEVGGTVLSDYRKDIRLQNIQFRYGGQESPLVLDDIDLTIPYGKTTAIVGTSGSGKTTLLKLMLKFYDPKVGNVMVGSENLRFMDSGEWRKRCGVVMQDGYIFSDTILRNITISDEQPDMQRFQKALEVANIQSFVDELPLRFQTMIGSNGVGLSQGQKQRLMIARAVYKQPEFLFFDEATSSLDANNEKAITDQLTQ
ncbi:MAG: peptidase domain-containing ABC transporter, partial [Bacteroidota bacterium]